MNKKKKVIERMSMPEFYQKLGELKRAGWRAYFDEARIRLRPKFYRQDFCPITAVHFLSSNQFFPLSCVEDVAWGIGLSTAQMNRIIDAADQSYHAKVRMKIAKILGLKLKTE